MTDTPMITKPLIVESFRKRAVRSAILIDENFPNLGDLINNTMKPFNGPIPSDGNSVNENPEQTEKTEPSSADFSEARTENRPFSEATLAGELYKSLHENGILCDIANRKVDWQERLSERIADSDLVVLDLNLDGSEDATESIKILRHLTSSRKFNLVVIYTKASELQKIARMVAGSLRDFKNEELEPEIEVEIMAALDDLQSYDAPIPKIVDAFLLGQELKRDLIKSFICDVFKSYPRIRKLKPAFLARIAKRVLQSQYDAISNDNDIGIFEADFEAPNPWFLCENAFVCFANKENTPPCNVLGLVDACLSSWNPGIIRAIMSQLRNTLGRRGYEFSPNLSYDIETQIAWLWNATNHVKGSSEEKRAVETLIRRLLSTFEDQLVTDSELSKFVDDVLGDVHRHEKSVCQLNEVKNQKWHGKKITNDISVLDVLHSLNVFESSKPFRREFITTGTLLMRVGIENRPKWLICVEPACDTVPSQASPSSHFLHCRLLELHQANTDVKQIARTASQAKHLFAKANNTREYFSIASKCTGQPVLHTAFVPKKSQLKKNAESYLVTVSFPNLGETLGFDNVEYEAVAQFHDAYANRLLHDTGHHLSRIGLDFVSLTDDLEEKSHEGATE
jgi:hypothetical protein